MIQYLKIVACVVFVLSFVDEVLCIKCWSCDSKLDPKCGVPFDNSTITLTDCSKMEPAFWSMDKIPNVCYTITQKVDGDASYSRGCGFIRGLRDDDTMSCSVYTNTSSVYMDYCPCKDKDGCNS